MKKLSQGECFNDNLIDLRVKHLVFKLLPSEQSHVHAFSCQFYTKLLEKSNEKDDCHALVARWTKKTYSRRTSSSSPLTSQCTGVWPSLHIQGISW
jgi:Ulp1 family protease